MSPALQCLWLGFTLTAIILGQAVMYTALWRAGRPGSGRLLALGAASAAAGGICGITGALLPP